MAQFGVGADRQATSISQIGLLPEGGPDVLFIEAGVEPHFRPTPPPEEAPERFSVTGLQMNEIAMVGVQEHFLEFQ